MSYDTINIERKGTTSIITLNRPDVHNAMNEQLMMELTTIFRHLSNDQDTHVIILSGAGKSFCAGADLNWMKSMAKYSHDENIRDSTLLLDLYETIYTCSKPVIGKINGHAFGGGLGLIAVCDITIGVPNSKFAFSEANLGIIPSVISSYIIPRINLATMRHYFITAEQFDTNTAQKIGLIDIIVDPEYLESTIDKYIEMLNTSGPKAIQEVKKLLINLQKMDIDKYKDHTVKKIAELRVSQEGQEGINAFLEKRTPKWRA
ncbi:MAG: enoyl-CoA hydratase/isomerase family protein [Candidatus Thermoplasmatota archaeon]|nr:enoyl-CoA hydratase/isomerase family protein [Candidatus Thermoplasmatota archaeon]